MATLSALTSSSFTNREVFDSAVLTGFANRKTFVAFFNGGASGFHCTPYEHGSSSGYLVPSGKKLILTTSQWVMEGTLTGKKIGIGSGSTDVGMSSTSAPTTHDFSGAATIPGTQYITTASGSQVLRLSYILVIPEGKYIYAYNAHTGASWLHLTGYEINATATQI